MTDISLHRRLMRRRYKIAVVDIRQHRLAACGWTPEEITSGIRVIQQPPSKWQRFVDAWARFKT